MVQLHGPFFLDFYKTYFEDSLDLLWVRWKELSVFDQSDIVFWFKITRMFVLSLRYIFLISVLTLLLNLQTQNLDNWLFFFVKEKVKKYVWQNGFGKHYAQGSNVFNILERRMHAKYEVSAFLGSEDGAKLYAYCRHYLWNTMSLAAKNRKKPIF